MRKIFAPAFFCCIVFLCFLPPANALDRQPASDYHTRREKLAAQLEGGFALVFAPPEAEGPNDLYGYRPDDNFYYLTGWTEPGAALQFNTAQTWNINTTYDLQTVAIHELGHALGLDHIKTYGDVMYNAYTGSNALLGATLRLQLGGRSQSRTDDRR